MKVFITGLRGFVGYAVASHLTTLGHDVAGSATQDITPLPGVSRISILRLGESFDGTIFEGVDALVHCANAVGANSYQTNVQGTLQVAEEAARRGVTYQLFVSSFSAHEGATSDYGRAKHEVQERMLQAGHAAIRPGLVIGPGGLFARIAKAVTASPILPLPDGHTTVIAIDDLAAAVARLVTERRRGLFELYLPAPVRLPEIAREIARATSSRTLVVPVPLWAGSLGARLMASLHPRFKPIEENLRGFRDNQNRRLSSDLRDFVAAPLSIAEIIAAAIMKSH